MKKLQEFKNGVDIVELFNRVRPSYLVSKYGDVLYNESMKTFKIENITKDEINSIKEWSKSAKNAGIIRDIVRKNFTNLIPIEENFKDNAKNILDMFKKYDSDFPKSKPLYRGKGFYIQKTKDKELYNNYISKVYTAYKDGTAFIPDIVFRSSSKSISEALKFAEVDNLARKSIIVTYKKRISSELDISKISKFTSEDEILIQGGISYKVIELKLDKQGNVFITLEELR